jgi:hypothetical protein
MTKRLILPVIFVLILSLMVSSVAYAADNATAQASINPNPPIEREGIPIIGLVTNIGTSQFTVQDRRGVDRVLLVTSTTRFTTLNGTPASFGDLQLYEWVLVTMTRTGEETIQAHSVILLPTNFNPSLIEQRSRGEVTSIDMTNSTFSILTIEGKNLTFIVNSDTDFLGNVHQLSNLQVGMDVLVGGMKISDMLIATLVDARISLVRYKGIITGVDLGSSTFTLQTHAGDSVTFTVDGNTRFRSRNATVNSLSDLSVGMSTSVIARVRGDGSYLATEVVAASRVHTSAPRDGQTRSRTRTRNSSQSQNQP